jgi:pimeloyl-ACP methyl ester carboxylesterase
MSDSNQVARTRHTFGVFRDHEADWVFGRTLQHMNVGAAQIGECLDAARKIDLKRPDGWIDEWKRVAEMVERHGDESLGRGHTTSAKYSYLRASNYYRTAEYGAPPSHPLFQTLWEKSVRCFREAARLLRHPVTDVEVPVDGFRLPGYYWRADPVEPRPTLILVGGNDGTIEENFLAFGFAAHERGYNFFTFDHPGHRGALHLYPDCVKRPDFEVPYRQAIDFVVALPGVDDRIAVAGESFGGYAGVRVASSDERVTAAVLNSPIIDVHEMGFSQWKGFITRIPKPVLGALIERKWRSSPLTYALKEYSAWSAGLKLTTDIDSMSQYYKQWRVPDEMLRRITCPVLAMASKGDGPILLRQAERFLASVSSGSKRLHVFSLEEDGSDDHIQLDNLSRGNQVMFDWIDETLSHQRQVVG